MAIDLTKEYSTVSAGYRSTTTIDKPTNTVDGDFLVAVIFQSAYQDSVTPPSGWTLLGYRVHSDADRGRISVFYKRASSEGSSWSWTHTYGETVGIVKRLTGVVASGDPEDVGESTAETDYSTSDVTCAAITTATDGAAVCMVVGLQDTSIAFGSHSLTNRVSLSGLCLDGDTQSIAGSTGSKSVGKADYVRAVAILFALKPAVTLALDQEGFRFRSDDGSESAATWKASQDTNITLAADTAARLRMLVNATGDPASKNYQLEYRHKPSGGSFGSWKKVIPTQ